LSRQYGDTKIATHELQNVMRRGIAANKYIDILNASRQQQKEISSATRIQTNYRSKLARQAFEREVMLNTSFTSTVFDPSIGFTLEEYDAFFGF
jgi:DNA-binding winged helix-turn-helix (wHTH) protein